MDSKALRLGIACVALLGLVACGNDNTPPVIVVTDSGTTDAGTTGPADSGVRPDSGPTTCGSIAGATGWPPLPASCTPRCASATLDAVAACGTDQACQQAAFDADTTPSAQLETGGTPLDVDCGGCVNFQGNSCVYDTCPTEFDALLTCLSTASSEAECATQNTALETCAMVEANAMAIQTCYLGTSTAPGRAYACFFGGGGASAPGARSPGASRSYESLPIALRYDFALGMSLAR